MHHLCCQQRTLCYGYRELKRYYARNAKQYETTMKIKIKVTLTTPMLGTKAANPNVFADFIASKHPDGTPAKDELDRAVSQRLAKHI